MKYWHYLLYGLGLIPLGFTLSLLAFYFHARKILGRFPTYNQPDPKEMEIYSEYYQFIELILIVWFFSFWVWLIAVIIYLIIYRKVFDWKPLTASLICQMIGICILFSEIFNWYID